MKNLLENIATTKSFSISCVASIQTNSLVGKRSKSVPWSSDWHITKYFDPNAKALHTLNFYPYSKSKWLPNKEQDILCQHGKAKNFMHKLNRIWKSKQLTCDMKKRLTSSPPTWKWELDVEYRPQSLWNGVTWKNLREYHGHKKRTNESVLKEIGNDPY